jgi:hypothetical protein
MDGSDRNEANDGAGERHRGVGIDHLCRRADLEPPDLKPDPVHRVVEAHRQGRVHDVHVQRLGYRRARVRGDGEGASNEGRDQLRDHEQLLGSGWSACVVVARCAGALFSGEGRADASARGTPPASGHEMGFTGADASA